MDFSPVFLRWYTFFLSDGRSIYAVFEQKVSVQCGDWNDWAGSVGYTPLGKQLEAGHMAK
ncbi:hypothetical protein D3C75_1330280 [compost metagenome]